MSTRRDLPGAGSQLSFDERVVLLAEARSLLLGVLVERYDRIAFGDADDDEERDPVNGHS